MTWEFSRIFLLCLLYLPIPFKIFDSSNSPYLFSPKVFLKIVNLGSRKPRLPEIVHVYVRMYMYHTRATTKKQLLFQREHIVLTFIPVLCEQHVRCLFFASERSTPWSGSDVLNYRNMNDSPGSISIVTKSPQSLSPGRFRRAESAWEVKNVEALRSAAETKENQRTVLCRKIMYDCWPF